MDYTLPGTPYAISRRDTGVRIVEVHDFVVGDAIVMLFHLCRTFPVNITYPKMDDTGKNDLVGFLWVPLSQKDKLDKSIETSSDITWRFVCIDVVNGEECAFYRNYKLKLVDIDKVRKRYFIEPKLVPVVKS